MLNRSPLPLMANHALLQCSPLQSCQPSCPHVVGLAGKIQGLHPLIEVPHDFAEVAVLGHISFTDAGDAPPLHDACVLGRAVSEHLAHMDRSPVGELNANRPLPELHSPHLAGTARRLEVNWQRPELEVLHVLGQHAIDLVEVGVVVQLLVANAPEFPPLPHPQLDLGIAVDREVVRDDGRDKVVLDAERPAFGENRPDLAAVLEVKPKARGLVHNKRLFHRNHGGVRRRRLQHDTVQEAQAAEDHEHDADQAEPPRQPLLQLGNSRPHLLLLNPLSVLQRLQVDNGAPGRSIDVHLLIVQDTRLQPASRQRYDHRSEPVVDFHLLVHFHVEPVKDGVWRRIDDVVAES
mmetsp:Transcript_28535/g.66449  ORF Transcript_28535/g.66449 Transcript_28535/m.66449 type:complete len:349 (+) Transcript_28535:126-1172(+)